MFGCLRKIGCLVVLLAAGSAYYWYTHRRVEPAEVSVSGTWFPVTREAAQRGTDSVLAMTTGPKSRAPYVKLNAAEAIGYFIPHAAHGFPGSVGTTQAMITGDTLHVRSLVDLKKLGASGALGPFGSVLSESDTVELAGTVSVVRPGVAQVHVVSARVRELKIPRAILPKLLQYFRGEAPDGVAPNAIPLTLPPSIGDLRIGNGKVTIYKSVS